MSRKPRVEYEGAIYHVIHRGNNCQYIFQTERDKLFLLDHVARYKGRMGFKLFSYVIMSNHYHFIMQAFSVSLHKIMHAINNCYSKYYNHVYGCTGHVFEGRYKVQDERYLLPLLRYMDRLHLSRQIF